MRKLFVVSLVCLILGVMASVSFANANGGIQPERRVYPGSVNGGIQPERRVYPDSANGGIQPESVNGGIQPMQNGSILPPSY